MIVAGLLVMSWPVVTWAYGVYSQERLRRAWPIVQVSPSADDAAAPRVTVQEAPFARLAIQPIGLDVMVVDGIDAVSLRRGPGHLPESGRPGESRNCAIAAHRDGWFARLEGVQVGDPVWIETPECGYAYAVDEVQVVTPDRTDLLQTGSYPTLTLITCTGPGYPTSTHRLLVHCGLRGTCPKL